MPTAILTGASMGLGEALAQGLARAGWSLVVDARGEPARGQHVAHASGLALHGTDYRGILAHYYRAHYNRRDARHRGARDRHRHAGTTTYRPHADDR